MQYRQTHQRKRILEIVQATDVHPTADWIYAKLKKEIPHVSLGTVYRNLNILIELGLIREMPFRNGFDRFEGNVAPHYHFVCERCGVVEDLKMPIYSRINQKAEKMSSFRISHHIIDFFGLCEKCQNKPKSNKGGFR